MLGAMSGGGKGTRVSPLANGGLDEALGLAIGFGRVRPGGDVLEAELPAGGGKGVITRSTRTPMRW